jgi:hypothetical protein
MKEKTEEMEQAWKLWKMIAEIEVFLWNHYYNYFLEKCMEDQYLNSSNHSQHKYLQF